MSGTCKNNDRYDISRNECATFPSATEYVKRLKNQHDTVVHGDRIKFSNFKEKLEHQTRVFHTRQYIEKGNPPRRFKKTAILTTGSQNECDQLVKSSIEQVARANFFLRRRYRDKEVV